MKIRSKAIPFPAYVYLIIQTGLIFLAVMLTYSPVSAEEALSEARVKELALEAILENPEIIEQAIRRLEQVEQQRQQAQVVSILTNRRSALERDENAPVLGNPNGDVTIVEFFDYNCPYCRRVKPEITNLLENDKNIRLIYREWPILGPGSLFAARAALASREQDMYEEFHWSLMALDERAEETTVLEAAVAIGIDIEQLQQDMSSPEIESHIALSMELAGELNINGTPTFIIGNSIAPGLVNADRLAEMVQQARIENN